MAASPGGQQTPPEPDAAIKFVISVLSDVTVKRTLYPFLMLIVSSFHLWSGLLEEDKMQRQSQLAVAFILIAGTLAGEISHDHSSLLSWLPLGTAVLFACLGLHLRIKTSDALMVQALFWMVTSFCYALYGRGSTTQRAIFFTGHLALLAILQGPPDLSSFVKNGCLVLAASTGMSFALNIEMRRDIVAERVSPRSRGERREGAPPEDALPQDAAESTDGSSSDLVHSGDDANDEADGNAAGNVESYRPAESPYQLTLSGRSATSDTLSSGTKSSVTTTSAPAAHHSPSVFESLSQDVEFREEWVEQRLLGSGTYAKYVTTSSAC